MSTEQIIAALRARVKVLSASHLGILSSAAIRLELAQLTTPVDLLVIDWRKLHEWNAMLTWDGANVAFGHAARVDYAGVDRRAVARGADRRLTPRAIDLRGQYGGDELVMAVDIGHGRPLLARLLRELIVMNAALTAAQVADISDRTGGLISGFCVAAILVEGSRHALLDAARAIDATGVLKAGVQTGSRASSGARGTVLGRIDA